MKTDPASLDQLREIVEPTAVSWWPPAIGWWGLLLVLLIAGGLYAYRWYRDWIENAYRRAALKELGSANTAADISKLLKRTALAGFPRHDIAALYGDAWCSWLQHTSSVTLSDSIRQSLYRGVFADQHAVATKELREFAAGWIRRHRAEPAERGVGGEAC